MEPIIKKATVGMVTENEVKNTADHPTYEQVLEMIDRRIAALQVYIVEAEITQAQNAVRAVVNEASF